MSIQILNLTENLYHYLQDKSLREHMVLRELREATATLSMARMQISPEQGQLISLLLELMNARRTLEIGVFTGYSTLAVALALPEDAKIIACDVNIEWTEIAKKFWQKAKVDHKIDLRIAPAILTLQQLVEQGEDNFDFAFIDADKANYLNYYELCLKLIRPGGLIMIDNVLWEGAVIDPADQSAGTNAIRQLNDFIARDDRVTISMLPLGDGITLARKRL